MTMWRRRILMLGGLLLVGAAIYLLPLVELLTDAAEWSDTHRLQSAAIFLVVFPICVVFLVPAAWFAMFAGFVFGVPTGIVLASAGSAVGAYLAFLNGRTLARNLVARRMQSSVRLQALDRAIASNTFLIVLLTRIALVIPANVLNYMYSVTSIRQLDYLLPSIIGVIPAMSFYVFLGSQASNAGQILSGELDQGRAGIVILAVSTAAIVIVGIVLQRAAAKVLQDALDG